MASLFAEAVKSAAKIVGDDVRLCQLLQVPAEEVSKWLSGESLPTFEGYIRALDIVTKRPEAGKTAT